jgi:hypothetical protein
MKSFKARMQASGSSGSGGMMRRLPSIDLGEEMDKFQRAQIYEPPTTRRPSSESEGHSASPRPLPPTPSPTVGSIPSSPSESTPFEPIAPARRPSLPTGPPPEPIRQPKRRLPSPPAEQLPGVMPGVIPNPTVLVQQPSDPTVLVEEPSKPKVFNAGHVTM